MDSMVVDLPLSIIYAATESVKRGYSVEAVDLRTEREDWRETIRRKLSKGVRLAGISVMTGSPLINSREISEFIKSESPQTKIVWGGPHPTVLPETVEEPYIDYLVRGYGSKPLAQIVEKHREGGDISGIAGLSYKKDGVAVHNPREKEFEIIHYSDLPYDLIDVNAPKYIRTYNEARNFPIFTSIGCPYQCAFCVHPAIYKEINGPKWLALEEEEILGHIEYVMGRYKVNHIVFIDDTSFPKLSRMKSLFERIIEKKLNITMEFRGARINEIMKMDDEFLNILVKAGGRMMMVGVESGSDKVLKGFQKGITREQILNANRKLARHPELTAYYNFIYGTPGETYEDLLETKDLVLTILRENPKAYFGFGGDWKPIPGTRTLETAEKDYAFKSPKTIDDWIQIDSSDADNKIVHSWYTAKHNDLIKLMQVSSFVIDDKIIRESRGNNSSFFKLLRLMSRIYKPIALFRLRRNFSRWMVEYELWRMMVRIMPQLRAALG